MHSISKVLPLFLSIIQHEETKALSSTVFKDKPMSMPKVWDP